MATPEEIINVLEMLSEYYDRTLTRPQLRIYVSQLADIQFMVLKRAAYDWIKGSPFFPRVSELRSSASRYPPHEPDYLLQQEEELTRIFFVEGTLDPAAWEDLARHYDRNDRLERAVMIRRSFLHLQTDYDENRHLTQQAKHRYRKWESLGVEQQKRRPAHQSCPR